MRDPRLFLILPLASALAGCIPQPMEGVGVPAARPAPVERPAPMPAPTPAPVQPDIAVGEPNAPATDPAGACEASRGYSLIGEMRSDALGTRALQVTGARTIRWIVPGSAVTMDYRGDRLNIDIDTQGRVVGMKCG